MNNQTFTTPCGTTFHVGQELKNYTGAGPLLDAFSVLQPDAVRYSETWYLSVQGTKHDLISIPHYWFPITITALPPQPEPEPETVGFDELDGRTKVWFIHPLTGAIDSVS